MKPVEIILIMGEGNRENYGVCEPNQGAYMEMS
jgi:hypothetical protein